MVLKDDFTLEWYVTHKFPLRDPSGKIMGIAGINARAGTVDQPPLDNPKLMRAMDHIRLHFDKRIGVAEIGRNTPSSFPLASFSTCGNRTRGCAPRSIKHLLLLP